jgi:hypothetical protein
VHQGFREQGQSRGSLVQPQVFFQDANLARRQWKRSLKCCFYNMEETI